MVSLEFRRRRDIFATVLFSIVTPSFNQGRFIRDCIESVRSQHDVDTEHIIVDACSTDETLSILKTHPHLRWVSEPDKGQTDAIIKGFLKATGNWLMWLNADDYLLPGVLKKVQQFIESHSDADVVYGDCTFVSEDGTPIRTKREGDFDFNMLLLYGCYIPSTATFYRRSIVEKGFLLDPSYKVCMDFEFFLKLAHNGFRFIHLPENLACFRWHEANVSAVHAVRRHQERLHLQRQYLKLTNRSYLGREWILKLLFRGYQAKRQVRRAVWRLTSQ